MELLGIFPVTLGCSAGIWTHVTAVVLHRPRPFEGRSADWATILPQFRVTYSGNSNNFFELIPDLPIPVRWLRQSSLHLRTEGQEAQVKLVKSKESIKLWR